MDVDALAHLRDKRRWRRAMSMSSSERAVTSAAVLRDALWTLYHRGTAVNAYSANFAGALRSVSLALRHDESCGACSDGRAKGGQHIIEQRPEWNASRRFCAHADVLVQLLCARLSQQGLGTHDHGSAQKEPEALQSTLAAHTNVTATAHVVAAACSDVSGRVMRPNVMTSFRWLVNELVAVERTRRRCVMLQERHARVRVRACAMRQLLRLCCDDEARARERIVAAYTSATRLLYATWPRLLLRVTGLSTIAYTQLCAMHGREHAHRTRLVEVEAMARKRLLRLCYSQQLQLVERAIAQCRRTEDRYRL